jgi:hypothetical protein
MRELKTKSPETPVKTLRKTQAISQSVMLSAALQRNAKHEVRLSNISGYLLEMPDREPEIESLASRTSSAALQLRFAQNDNKGAHA